MSRLTRHATLLLLAALLLAGCSDDATTPDPDPEPEGYPFAASEDQAMANFKRAYEEMNRDVYVDVVLDDPFTFVFAAGSPYAPTGGWDRGAEVSSITRLFAGEGGYDTVQGVPKPGVADIEFRTLIRLMDWEDVASTDPDFPSARRALYEVEIVFVMQTGTYLATITVAGQQFFYVRGVEEPADGTTRTHWRLCGQKDLTAEAKGNETVSWGRVKSLYR